MVFITLGHEELIYITGAWGVPLLGMGYTTHGLGFCHSWAWVIPLLGMGSPLLGMGVARAWVPPLLGMGLTTPGVMFRAMGPFALLPAVCGSSLATYMHVL